jgi:hypothetical protein
MDNKAQEFVLQGIRHISKEMGQHTFQWLFDSNYYPCYASVQTFKRDLETGGFSIDLLITMTVPLFDINDEPTFPNGIPIPQQKILYNGNTFRIASIVNDTIGDGARLRITGYSPFKGA